MGSAFYRMEWNKEGLIKFTKVDFLYLMDSAEGNSNRY